MRSRVSLTLSLLLLLTVSAYGVGDHDRQEVEVLPAHINAVQSGGFWRSGAREGHYRIVVTSGGFEHVISHLFIQWVAIDDDRRETEIVHTVSVKEFDSGYAAAIEPRLKGLRGGNLQIELTVTRRDNTGREKRTVTVRPDGTYTFK